jgi:hypothetical protein
MLHNTSLLINLKILKISIKDTNMVVKAAFFNIFGDIRIFLDFLYNRLIILKIIGFCCIEWEVGVLSNLTKVLIKGRFLFNN